MSFMRIKKNYELHLWTLEMVKNSVKKGYITTEEYKLITNTDYEV